jgi:hypothetical protein
MVAISSSAYADPCGQFHISKLLVQLGYRSKNRQSGADSPLLVVAMSLWPAKISHDSVAEVFSDPSTETFDLPRARPLVLRSQLAGPGCESVGLLPSRGRY